MQTWALVQLGGQACSLSDMLLLLLLLLLSEGLSTPTRLYITV
jgi:hypothetical protein